MKNILDLLRMQNQLQINMREANPNLEGSPLNMVDDEAKARFLTWNHTALIVELSEALDEVGWKPWASSRHINIREFIHEMVDAEHFKLNMLLAAAALSGWSIEQVAEEFDRYYDEKNAKNLHRQVTGYDGVTEKCPQCHRDLQETNSANRVACLKGILEGKLVHFCSSNCHKEFHNNEERV